MIFLVRAQNRVSRSDLLVVAESEAYARAKVHDARPDLSVLAVVEHGSDLFLLDIEPLRKGN